MEKQVLTFLEAEIEQENIPGAAIYVSHQGKPMMQSYIGSRTLYPDKQPVEEDTVYDLASLTKVVATLPSILQLLDNGSIRLDDKISYFLPSFHVNEKENVTIKHLLTHTSGLPAHRQFYAEALRTEQIIARICEEQLVMPEGSSVIYSDLGFILLSALIEKVAGQCFEKYVTQNIFQPLNMNETGFNLPFNKIRFAATEYSEKLGDYKYGIVHDDNAESMGGISGHAGLFSTIQDLANFTSMIENNGVYNGKRIISSPALKLSKQNFTSFASEARGLGWQMKSPGALSCGDLFSPNSYGHTGYTGTSIWFDPEIQLHVILLTNRVHAQNKDAILRLRPRLHNIIRTHF